MARSHSEPGGDPFRAFFAPQSIAVIGATETAGSVGRTLMENLASFPGEIYPVHPSLDRVFGKKAHAAVNQLPKRPELAVIATAAARVPEIIRQCGEIQIPNAIIISAGFKEAGSEGAALEDEVRALARQGQMRIIGPNCLGVMAPHTGLNATFASGMARRGNVAFISQSGALCTAVLDWSLRENVGFSAFISIGSMLDVSWGDLIYYLEDDPKTRSIVIYMESVGNARSFLSAAREVALTKPIIVIKVGRTEAAAKAAASHTGSLTGSDMVLEAAFRRCGVSRVNTIEELFDMAEVLAKQPRPRGPRLSIVTNAGGPAALATDALISGGGQLAEMTPAALNAFNHLLPAHWSHGNPIDILGDAGPERYAKAVEIASQQPGSDGLLVILTPQAMTDPARTAEALQPFTRLEGQPVLASWMGGDGVALGEDYLNAAGVPTFKYPDRAARTFAYMWQYSRNLNSLYETPSLEPESEENAGERQKVGNLLEQVLESGRTLLTELESKKVLAAYRIPTTETKWARSERQAVELAQRLEGPVAIKLHSETLTHKSDVGGVHLHVKGAHAVRRAWRSIKKSVSEKAGPQHFRGVTVQPMVERAGYELILGSTCDLQFGPILLFGSGGQLVEIYKDRAVGLPPLNSTLARRLMEQTRVYEALKGVRGRPAVDLAKLENLLVRFSFLVADQPRIKEIDINPLLVSHEGMIALDARIILHEASLAADDLPRLAIRPYPNQYASRGRTKSGLSIQFRPIRPEDEPMMVQFHQTLSEQSVYYRYFSPLKLAQRTAHERLVRMCFNDYDREIALVARRAGSKKGNPEILGIGRLSKLHGANEAEFALLIGDPWQGQGIGSELLKRLVEIARRENLDRVSATIMAENRAMQHVSRKAGFTLHFDEEAHEFRAELDLT